MPSFRCFSGAIGFFLTTGALKALPPDFAVAEFVGGLRDPATMAFAPDGRLFVGERIEGKLRIVTASGQLLAAPFLQLDVPPVRHRSGGLRGFAFDPQYPAEPYLYVFYTKQFAGTLRHNRVSRFTVSAGDPNLANPASEVVLLELPFNNDADGSSGSHNGGAVVFGGDGKLYVTTGDGWNNSGVYAQGDSVQSLSTYTGKIFRLNRDGTIPTDNPFYNTASGDYRAIYALGFRNPYAAAVHPVTGEVFVFDVGDANGGNKDYIYRVAAGENYGHDGYGGIGTSASVWAYIGTRIISGGTWYFADQFPATYRERLFVTSWKKGLKTVQSVTNTTVEEFGSDAVNDQGPVYPCVGPDGSIYFLDSTYETSNGRVYKLSYTNINRADTPAISPNGGTYADSVSVSLSTTSPGATIRYTTDGSDPDVASPLYSPPSLTLTNSATLKARAYASGFDPSTIAEAVFTVEVSTPPSFTNTAPSTATMGTVYQHTVTSNATPAATYSLDTAPAGMAIHPETGEIFWPVNTTGSVPVTIRAGNGIAPDALQGITINVTNLRPADAPDLANLTQGGLRYSYFEGADAMQAKSAGTVAMPTLTVRERDDDFRLRFEGYIDVTTAGIYEFNPSTAPGDEVSLFIGGVEARGFPIGLETGMHSFAVDYKESTGVQALTVLWDGPTFDEEFIPSSALYHDTTPYGQASRSPLPPYLATFPTDEAGSLPATLTDTGAFEDVASLKPIDGVVAYTPNAKLWSDGADKLRWIALPYGTEITYATTGHWVYPPGTVFIKHFEIGAERKRIETRFEIVKEGGSSYLVTYRWRANQSEADLVPDEGADGLIDFDGKSQQWFFPSRAECVACHNSSVGYVLGSSTRQLNGGLTYYSGITDNQLRTWSHLEMFDAPPADSTLTNLDALSPVDDDFASLEERVRSYFDSNCAYCHNSTAAPEGTNFVLEYDTPIALSGLINGVGGDDLGLGSLARIIAARDPKYSTLYHRLAGNDPATRMPPVGRTIVHDEAREALVRWILSLPPSNTLVDINDYTHRWTFDNTAGTGTWRDTANAPTYATGQVNQALTFDGSDDAVDLGPLDAASGTGLTITLWFRADDFGISDARFLSKADGQFDQDHYWMISTLNGSQLRLRLRAGGNTTTLISPSGTLSTGTWTHVTARYDGATMKLFKDGVEVASTAKTGVLDTNGTVDAAIGNQPTTASGGSRPFDGLIDDVRIYPRALSESEISTVRDAGGVPNSAPTIQLATPVGAVGGNNHITRANAASNLLPTASDAEDGDLSGEVTWLSTSSGDISPTTLPDGPHTLIATTRDINGSADSTLVSLTVVPGFEGWAEDHGVPSTPLLDHNANGYTLLEEYAFRVDPTATAFPSPVSPEFDGLLGKISLTFPMDPLAIDLTYTALFSEDLDVFTEESWTPLGDAVSGDQGALRESSPGQIDIEAISPASSSRHFGTIRIEKD
ncbi:MAG: PQQ-dependent sugar dehydrogenase [Verrucomicrobiota bacterium]